MHKLSMMILGLTIFAAPLAPAQTLYKLVDKNGKITYSESPPKEFDGKVIRIDIDPNANTATLPKAPAPNAGAKGMPGEPVGVPGPAGAALAKVEKARKALDDARDNPSAGDFRRLGSAAGGARPVPTDEYLERLSALEQALKKAESEARKFEDAK